MQKKLILLLMIAVATGVVGCGPSKEAEDVAAIRSTLDKQEAQKEADKAADKEKLQAMRKKAEADYQAALKASAKK